MKVVSFETIMGVGWVCGRREGMFWGSMLAAACNLHAPGLSSENGRALPPDNPVAIRAEVLRKPQAGRARHWTTSCARILRLWKPASCNG